MHVEYESKQKKRARQAALPMDPYGFRFLRPSALRELEASACFLAAVFLTLDHSRVTRHEAALLEHAAQIRFIKCERAGNTVAERAGLTGKPAA
jgi:hypothetical protein